MKHLFSVDIGVINTSVEPAMGLAGMKVYPLDFIQADFTVVAEDKWEAMTKAPDILDARGGDNQLVLAVHNLGIIQ